MPLSSFRAFAILLCTVGLTWATGAVQSLSRGEQSAELSLAARVLIAAKLYSAIQNSFAQWTPPLRAKFAGDYEAYLNSILNTRDRRTFDLAAMRLVAALHNGHTFFADTWLDKERGAPLGFNALYLDRQWVVTSSQLALLPVGTILDNLDGVPVDDVFKRNQGYIPDSSERAQRTDFFALPILFPPAFSLVTREGKTVRIVRGDPLPGSTMASEVTGRWLREGAVAYIKIPAFSGIPAQAKALTLLESYRGAKALIVDLRGNPGGRGDPPDELQMAFMQVPYRSWIETSVATVGRLGSLRYTGAKLHSGEVWIHPEGRPGAGVFQGKLLLLVDRICASYCEQFVLPLLRAGRAQLVGEPTAGTYAQTIQNDLGEGMTATIAATTEISPDGAPFEGIGITPTVRVDRTLADLRSGKDMVLETALKMTADP